MHQTMIGDPLRIPMGELSVLPAPLAGKEGRAVPPQTPSLLSAFGPRAVSYVGSDAYACALYKC